eukprot:2532928-Rhodomonas_salina.2
MLLSGLFLFIFAVAFLAVGGGSLALVYAALPTLRLLCTFIPVSLPRSLFPSFPLCATGERFTTTVEAYCTKHCGAVEDGVRRREDGTGERRVDADQRERRREGQEDEPRAPIHPFLDSKPSRGDDPQRRNGGGEEETGRRVEAQEGEAEQIVGCDCSTSPPSPSIPTQVVDLCACRTVSDPDVAYPAPTCHAQYWRSISCYHLLIAVPFPLLLLRDVRD